MGLFAWFNQPTRSQTIAIASGVETFLQDLITVAPAVGEGCYCLPDGAGGSRGWVQFIVHSPRRLLIHRLWTLRPGKGNGSALLRIVCETADRHEVELALKALPFGKKPYANSQDQLVTWYERHGFKGTHKKMIRQPLKSVV
jgi:hypothetical protein